jgi:DNA-binding IscR family transcriptional regulator
MKLNRPTLHTIHAVIWIAQHGDGAIVGGPAIAKAFGMIDEQMRAMLMVAARAGILVGIKGPNGGYRLARPAGKITLLEIIEAASGGIEGALVSKNGAAKRIVRAVEQAAMTAINDDPGATDPGRTAKIIHSKGQCADGHPPRRCPWLSKTPPRDGEAA